MRVADDMPAVVTPEGFTITPKAKLEPPTKTGYFGWLDFAEDENTVRYDDILAAMRNAADGRYYIYIRGVQQPMPMPREAYFRLLHRMGWTEGKAIRLA